MELLIVVIALGVLGALANRFGYDSRDRLASDEERMSAQGFVWGRHAQPHAAAPRLTARPIRLTLLRWMPRWGWRHLQA
jgi:hypothetical protein